MGGSGSGRWYRWDKKATLEEMRRIDVRVLKRYGYFDGWMATGVMHWQRGGKSTGSVDVKVYDNTVALRYKKRVHDEEWCEVEETANILSTPCHYGGERKWLQCPCCRRRVGILALGEYGFACRHCYRLPYGCQQEDKYHRTIRSLHKLGSSIFENYDGFVGRKRKGMHQRTFDRQLTRYLELEESVDAQLLQRCVSAGISPGEVGFKR